MSDQDTPNQDAPTPAAEPQGASNLDQVKGEIMQFTRGEFFFAAGSLLAAICVFLPWLSIGGEFAELAKAAGAKASSSGFDAGWRGWMTFFGGLACALATVLKPILPGKLTPEQIKGLTKGIPIIGLVVFGVVLITFLDLAGEDHFHVGIGLWLALLGMLGAAGSVVVSNYFADKPFAAFFAAPMFPKK
jgi:hypothetical protein